MLDWKRNKNGEALRNYYLISDLQNVKQELFVILSSVNLGNMGEFML